MLPLIRCMCVKFETTASNLKIAGLEDPTSRGTLHGCKWDQAENTLRAGQRILLLTLLMVACFTCDHCRLVCEPRIVNRSITTRLSRFVQQSGMGQKVSVKFWNADRPNIRCFAVHPHFTRSSLPFENSPHLQVRDVGDVRQSRKVSCNRPADSSNGGFPFIAIVSLVVRC